MCLVFVFGLSISPSFSQKINDAKSARTMGILIGKWASKKVITEAPTPYGGTSKIDATTLVNDSIFFYADHTFLIINTNAVDKSRLLINGDWWVDDDGQYLILNKIQARPRFEKDPFIWKWKIKVRRNKLLIIKSLVARYKELNDSDDDLTFEKGTISTTYKRIK